LCFSGFAFVRPTPASIRLYGTAWDLYVKYHKAHDQAYINLAIDKLNGDIRRAPDVRIRSLSRSLFPCGVYYFEHQHRVFENKPPCPECVVVHNNYMGSIAAKVPLQRFILSVQLGFFCSFSNLICLPRWLPSSVTASRHLQTSSENASFCHVIPLIFPNCAHRILFCLLTLKSVLEVIFRLLMTL